MNYEQFTIPPKRGGYGSRISPNTWVLQTPEKCRRGALDLMDKYLGLAEKSSEKEYRTSSLIEDLRIRKNHACKFFQHCNIPWITVRKIGSKTIIGGWRDGSIKKQHTTTK